MHSRRILSNNRITVPQEVIDDLQLEYGDVLEVTIVMHVLNTNMTNKYFYPYLRKNNFVTIPPALADKFEMGGIDTIPCEFDRFNW